ncbi:hypothetical protein MJO28_008133 [Puccinia striiformis f. sp. tritici]|uniref:Uncharacterized protein n=1 Tax=Puccinia striiformis f. sp. tritici TaxID=168172 RepID=A0ACC0EA62_9BASI|nr:hypothetical protein MJO28_008133 [Puccinia striiformis f. sp. tritici]KAI7952405.1 hypothetical protein MJO29_008036 [Puccinia striiformis f. sp. tritici]
MLLSIKYLPVLLVITLHGQFTEGKGKVDLASDRRCPRRNPLPVCLKVQRVGQNKERQVSARKGIIEGDKGNFNCRAYADSSHDDELLKALCCSTKVALQTQNKDALTKPPPTRVK